VLSTLPSQGVGLLAAQSADQPNKKIQSRSETPHKNLPSPKDLLDEGKGLKKTLPKDTPLKTPKQCRFRDVNCQAKQKTSSPQIGANPPASENSAPSQVASAKPTGNWFQRLGKKITSAFSGATLSAVANPSPTGNSFLPAAPAIAPAAPPPPPSFSSLNEAKLDPHNRIGTGREDLFSGNYHWSTPLVSLPGRNGLDLNLTLHYNSLQWVRYSNTMFFDPDWYVTLPTGLTTGFNFGFPELESGYTYDGAAAYVVTLPSGYRVPLRQVGTTNKYEAVDGSYLYLSVQSPANILYTPDGTQYTYNAYSNYTGARRCSQVKDSNGNYLTIAYNALGSINTITDTAGRVLNFSYDSTYGHLLQITQNWLGQAHVLAQFDYELRPLSYNFSGLTINGPASGSQISVLTRVVTSDGARHTFVYNGWGIVEDIFLYGALDNQRAAADYVYPSSSTPLSDCPRFSQRNDAIWGWGGQWYVPSTGLGWAANYFAFDPNETWGQITTPDGVVHKELFSTAAGTRGLSIGMETIVGGIKRKWTATNWLSDSTTKPMYLRISETNIYDDANGDGTADNRRRATITYTPYTKTQAQSTMPYTVYLPTQTTEYAANAATVYRSTQSDYLDHTNYWSRWIIGLPTAQRLYDGASVLQAQMTYGYDEFYPESHGATVRQHDTSNYGSSLFTRGNPTSARRYSVVNGVVGSYTQTQTYYHLTGLVMLQRDALNHDTWIYYDDAFATYADDASNTETVVNLTPKTFAYPTRVEDPDDNSSYVKYWYDTGAVTRATNPKGAAAISIYETAYGRVTKAKNAVNGAYTRYVYDTGHNWVQTWSTVNDATETAVLSLLDGASRERQHVDEHPGSAGTLSSWYQVYDLMGRVVERSNPTEISSVNWVPTGDDTAYIISTQTYDWNHRPRITTKQDGAISEVSYNGCGCAGGQVTTFTDEAGRQQKSYADFLGRTFKTELMDGTTVARTNTVTFNVRDQVTESRQIEGTNGVNRITTIQYDGYGRLWKRRTPTETNDTTWTYNNEDDVQTITDARGASATHSYNNRGLLTGITYSGGSVVSAPVTYVYDSVGQRTWMYDGRGSVNYNYDTLSRMTSETRHFNDITSMDFTISYDYNLVGQLKSVTDPYNNTINYNRDKVGRISNITGSAISLGGGLYQTNYLTNFQYRAWGAPKHYEFKPVFANYETRNADSLYNSRMQLTRYDIQNELGAAYRYHDLDANGNPINNNDGQLRFVDDLYKTAFDRSFTYDYAGRVRKVETGSRARGDFSTTYGDGPYKQEYQYNAFGEMSSRTGKMWWEQNAKSYTATYTNGLAPTFVEDGVTKTRTHDASGRITYEQVLVTQGYTQWIDSIFDTAGKQVETHWRTTTSQYDTHQYNYYDGDGLLARSDGTFYVRSSVLGGQVLSQIDSASHTTNVWYGGKTIAQQSYTTYYQVNFLYGDPHGQLLKQSKGFNQSVAVDPLGMAAEAPNTYQSTSNYYNQYYQDHAKLMSSTQGTGKDYSNPQVYGSGCNGVLDGVPTSCNTLIQKMNNGQIGGGTLSTMGILASSDLELAKLLAVAGLAANNINGDRRPNPNYHADDANPGPKYASIGEMSNLDEQESTKPDCITPRKLLYLDYRRNDGTRFSPFKEAWDETFLPNGDVKGEAGGVLLYEKATDTLYVFKFDTTGARKITSIPNPLGQFDKWFDVNRGRDLRFIAVYHTHPPPTDTNPSIGYGADTDILREMNVKSSSRGVGIIISGDSNKSFVFSFYDREGPINYAENPTFLDTCIQLERTQLRVR
jgi:hypothetical protein